MMKKLCGFFIAFMGLFIWTNVYALECKTCEVVGPSPSILIDGFADLYVYLDEPIVGEKPCSKADVRIEYDDGTVTEGTYDIFWYNVDDENEDVSIFENGKKYYYEFTNDIYNGKHIFTNKEYINGTKYKDNDDDNFYNYYFMIPLPPRKYDNTSSGLVHITDISLDSKSTTTTISETPSYKDLDVSFGFGFVNVDDFVKYRVVVKNDDSVDYTLKSNSLFSDSGYVKYDLDFEGDSNLIKANSEKTFYITAKYMKEVPEEMLVDGVYTESNNTKLVFSNDKIVNPSTGNKIFMLIGLILIVLIGLGVVKLNKETKVMMFIIIGVLMFIPSSINALNEISINVNADVKVQKLKEFCTIEVTGVCSYTFSNKKTYYYLPGSTLYDVSFNSYNNINNTVLEFDYTFVSEFTNNGFNNAIRYNENDLVRDSSQGCYLAGPEIAICQPAY